MGAPDAGGLYPEPPLLPWSDHKIPRLLLRRRIFHLWKCESNRSWSGSVRCKTNHPSPLTPRIPRISSLPAVDYRNGSSGMGVCLLRWQQDLEKHQSPVSPSPGGLPEWPICWDANAMMGQRISCTACLGIVRQRVRKMEWWFRVRPTKARPGKRIYRWFSIRARRRPIRRSKISTIMAS